MRDGWHETVLGRVASFQNGYPFKPSELTGQGLPVVRIKQLLDPAAEVDRSDQSIPDRFRINDGDLIFSWSGTLASRMWDRGPALLNQHLFRVVERPGVERRWLHLALHHATTELLKKSHGTTMKHVTKKVLESHPILLPPVPEQRRLVHLMDSLDCHMDNTAREITAIRALTSALLGSGQPGFQPTDEWRVVPFESAIDFREGPGIMAVDFREDGVPLIRLAGLTPGKSLLYKCNFLDPAKVAKKLAHFRVDVADVLLSTSASLGRVAVVDAEAAGAVPYTGIIRMRPATQELDPQYIPYILRAPHFVKQVEDAGVGTVMAHFGPSHLRGMTVPLPPLVEQRRIVGVMQEVDRAEELLQAEVHALSALRQALLADVLDGGRVIGQSYDVVMTGMAEVC